MLTSNTTIQMVTGSQMVVFAAALITVAAFVWTLYIRPKDVPEPLPLSPTQHLEDRKKAIYENLRDLQFEFRLGKLSDEDYQQTKQALQRELAVVLAETDEIVKRLGLIRPEPSPVRADVKPAGTACPQCGAQFERKLKFCGECGRAIA